MRNINIRTVVSILIIVCVAYLMVMHFLPRKAEEDIKVAVINNSRLISNVKGFSALEQEFSRKESNLNQQIDSLIYELNIDVDQYQTQKEGLSQQQRSKSEQLFLKRREEIMSFKELTLKGLGDEKLKATQKIFKPVDKAIENYAKKHGYLVVIGANNNSSVLYTHKSIDITDEILKIVNEE